jgi:hypothetical protein
MKRIMLLAIVGTLLFCKYAKAGDWEDIWAPYLERHDKATATSGNAQAINRNTHMITPWPYYVRNRNIPANGARMVGQYKRYEKGRSLDKSEQVPFPSNEESSSQGGQSSLGGLSEGNSKNSAATNNSSR